MMQKYKCSIHLKVKLSFPWWIPFLCEVLQDRFWKEHDSSLNPMFPIVGSLEV